MIRASITGGIGSGKTTVSKIFNALGIPVFNSDLCAREAENNPEIKEGYRQILGEDIYVDGKVDRAKIRSVLFSDKEKLKQVNALVIPYIKKQFESFCEQNEGNHQIVMLESAILFETGGEKNFQYNITVTASEDTRIKRAMKRDNSTCDEVMNKIKNQWPEQDKIIKSDFIIINDGEDLIDSLLVLTKQVETIKKAILCDLLVTSLSNLINSIKTNK